MCAEGRSYRKERGQTRERKREEWMKRKWDVWRGVEGVKSLNNKEEGSGDEYKASGTEDQLRRLVLAGDGG